MNNIKEKLQEIEKGLGEKWNEATTEPFLLKKGEDFSIFYPISPVTNETETVVNFYSALFMGSYQYVIFHFREKIRKIIEILEESEAGESSRTTSAEVEAVPLSPFQLQVSLEDAEKNLAESMASSKEKEGEIKDLAKTITNLKKELAKTEREKEGLVDALNKLERENKNLKTDEGDEVKHLNSQLTRTKKAKEEFEKKLDELKAEHYKQGEIKTSQAEEISKLKKEIRGKDRLIANFEETARQDKEDWENEFPALHAELERERAEKAQWEQAWKEAVGNCPRSRASSSGTPGPGSQEGELMSKIFIRFEEKGGTVYDTPLNIDPKKLDYFSSSSSSSSSLASIASRVSRIDQVKRKRSSSFKLKGVPAGRKELEEEKKQLQDRNKLLEANITQQKAELEELARTRAKTAAKLTKQSAKEKFYQGILLVVCLVVIGRLLKMLKGWKKKGKSKVGKVKKVKSKKNNY